MTTATLPPPVVVTGRLDPQLSRWLWLVKWLLALPHFLVLAVLWPVFVVTSVVAGFAILITGRYPQALFELNAGILRWSWRVGYYSYGALGTDRYPPFTLRDVPDYPARLEIACPDHLSRGLVLVKWWLLALPHYLVVGLFLGGGWWVVDRTGDDAAAQAPGLIGLLVLVAAVVLAFSGRYPQGVFDLVLGLNRWVLRVAAYAGLMTDQYPPFRLDMGGEERGASVLDVPSSSFPPPTGGGPLVPPPPRRSGSGGTVLAVLGAILLLPSLGLLAGGGVTLWADQTQRDAAGLVTSDETRLVTSTPAIVTEPMDLQLDGPDGLWLEDLVGDVRLRVTATDGSDVFVGVARTPDVDAYLGTAPHDVVTDVRGDDDVRYTRHGTVGTLTPPAAEEFWLASDQGTGTRSVTVTPEDGTWTAVVMRSDASPSLSVEADVAGELPALTWVAAGLLAAGAVLLAGAAVLIALGARALSARPSGS